MCVGEKIKSYLKQTGITQKWLSTQTKITPEKLNLTLNGKRKMKFEDYVRICEALHVSADKFITPKVPEA